MSVGGNTIWHVGEKLAPTTRALSPQKHRGQGRKQRNVLKQYAKTRARIKIYTRQNFELKQDDKQLIINNSVNTNKQREIHVYCTYSTNAQQSHYNHHVVYAKTLQFIITLHLAF